MCDIYLQRVHPERLEEYNIHKMDQRQTTATKRTVNSLVDRSSQPLIQKYMKGSKVELCQKELDSLVTNYIVNSMSSITIVDEEPFQSLIKGKIRRLHLSQYSSI